jgi:hypothetical protein
VSNVSKRAIDAGGGFQNYPYDYQVIEGLYLRMGMIVRMVVMVRTPFAVSSRDSLSRGENESAGLDPLCADQVVREVSDLPGRAAQQDHFQAALVVEVNVSCGHDLVEVMVLHVGQAPGDPADVMVVNQGHDAHCFAVVLSDCLLDQSRAHQAADRLAAVGITVQLAVTIKEAKQFSADRHTEPDQWIFHRVPRVVAGRMR